MAGEGLSALVEVGFSTVLERRDVYSRLPRAFFSAGLILLLAWANVLFIDRLARATTTAGAVVVDLAVLSALGGLLFSAGNKGLRIFERSINDLLLNMYLYMFGLTDVSWVLGDKQSEAQQGEGEGKSHLERVIDDVIKIVHGEERDEVLKSAASRIAASRRSLLLAALYVIGLPLAIILLILVLLLSILYLSGALGVVASHWYVGAILMVVGIVLGQLPYGKYDAEEGQGSLRSPNSMNADVDLAYLAGLTSSGLLKALERGSGRLPVKVGKAIVRLLPEAPRPRLDYPKTLIKLYFFDYCGKSPGDEVPAIAAAFINTLDEFKRGLERRGLSVRPYRPPGGGYKCVDDEKELCKEHYNSNPTSFAHLIRGSFKRPYPLARFTEALLALDSSLQYTCYSFKVEERAKEGKSKNNGRPVALVTFTTWGYATDDNDNEKGRRAAKEEEVPAAPRLIVSVAAAGRRDIISDLEMLLTLRLVSFSDLYSLCTSGVASEGRSRAQRPANRQGILPTGA